MRRGYMMRKFTTNIVIHASVTVDESVLNQFSITDCYLAVATVTYCEAAANFGFTVDSLVTHGSHTPYSLKFHTFLSPPSWFAGKSAS